MLLLLVLQVCDLGDPDPDVRDRATAALRNAGARAVPALVEALKSADQEVVSRADILLDCLAASAPNRAYALELMDVETDGLRVRCRVCVTNRSRVPIAVDPARLRVENLREDQEGRTGSVLHRESEVSRRVRLLPGASFERRVTGTLTRRGPRPSYLRDGVPIVGEAADVGPPTGDGVRIYALRNAQASTMASLLHEAFRPGREPVPPPEHFVDVLADTRTNSIIVRATDDHHAIIDQIVAELDRDPTER